MAKYLRCWRDFSGGLSELANDNMGDDQLMRAVNIIPGEGAGIARSWGTEQLLPQLPDVDYNHRLAALIPLTLADQSNQLLAFTAYPSTYQRVYRLNADGQGWTKLAEGQQPMIDHFVHAHKLYWLDGGNLKCYDGAVISNCAIIPASGGATADEIAVWNKVRTAVAVEQRGQRWFYASRNNELIFSEIGHPCKIDPTSIINVNTKNDDSITALKEFNNGLLIFKRQSVHFLAGWDLAGGSDVSLSQLNVTSGAVWPKTVRTVENAVLYLGGNGLYRLHVPGNAQLIAAENISERRIGRALYADGELADAYAEVWDNTYFLALRPALNTAPIREFRYFPQLRAFFGEYTQQPSCYSLYQGRLCLGVANGYVLCYDRDSYHYLDPISGENAAIGVFAATKGFDAANAMAQDIKLKSVLAVCRQYKQQSSHINIRVKADYSDSQYQVDLLDLDESLLYGEGEFGATYWGWKDTVTKEMPVQRKAKRVWFYLSDDHIDEPLLIYGLGLLYRKRKPRGSSSGVTRTTVHYED